MYGSKYAKNYVTIKEAGQFVLNDKPFQELIDSNLYHSVVQMKSGKLIKRWDVINGITKPIEDGHNDFNYGK